MVNNRGGEGIKNNETSEGASNGWSILSRIANRFDPNRAERNRKEAMEPQETSVNSNTAGDAVPQIEQDVESPQEIMSSETHAEAPRETIDVSWTREGHIQGGIENAFTTLQQLSKKYGGALITLEFNEKMLNSDMTEDEIFMTMFGKTKEEYMKRITPKAHSVEEMKRQGQANERLQEEKRAKVSEVIEKGKEMVYSQNQEQWKEYIERESGSFSVDVLSSLSSVMSSLEDPEMSLDDIDKIIDQTQFQPTEVSFLRSTIFSYSKKGPDYLEAHYRKHDVLTPERSKMIAHQRLKNAKMELHDLGEDIT